VAAQTPRGSSYEVYAALHSVFFGFWQGVKARFDLGLYIMP